MYTADRLRVEIVASGVTAGAGITAIFQDSNDGITWVSGKTVAITTNATVSILVNPETEADLAYLPFRAHGRVVITSGAGSAVTVDQLYIYQGI
jgi:hypothetical protein